MLSSHFRKIVVVIVLALALGIAGAALGHDLWILPPTTTVPGEMVTIRLTQGMDFPLPTDPPDVSKFKRILAIGPDGKPAEIAPAAPDPVARAGCLKLKTTTSGIYIVAVETSPKPLSLPADSFNAYLVSDGMPDIFLERTKDGTLRSSSRERYSKTPKMLFQVGDGNGDASRVVGLKTEICPLLNPFKLRIGSTLPVRVIFDGHPLADVWLGWDHGGDGDAPSGMVRTDEKGQALVPIAKTGLMTLRVTYMTHPMKEDFEWESFWTTLTFSIP